MRVFYKQNILNRRDLLRKLRMGEEKVFQEEDYQKMFSPEIWEVRARIANRTTNDLITMTKIEYAFFQGLCFVDNLIEFMREYQDGNMSVFPLPWSEYVDLSMKNQNFDEYAYRDAESYFITHRKMVVDREVYEASKDKLLMNCVLITREDQKVIEEIAGVYDNIGDMVTGTQGFLSKPSEIVDQIMLNNDSIQFPINHYESDRLYVRPPIVVVTDSYFFVDQLKGERHIYTGLSHVMPDYTCENDLFLVDGSIRDELRFRSYIRNRYDYFPICMYMMIKIKYEGIERLFHTLEAADLHLKRQKLLKEVECKVLLFAYAKGHNLEKSVDSSFEFDVDYGEVLDYAWNLQNPRRYRSIKKYLFKKNRFEDLIYRMMDIISQQFCVQRFQKEPNVRVRGVIHDEVTDREIRIDKPNQYTIWVGNWRNIEWQHCAQNNSLRERHGIRQSLWYRLSVGTNQLLWNKRVLEARKCIMNNRFIEWFDTKFVLLSDKELSKRKSDIWKDKIFAWFEVKFSYDN